MPQARRLRAREAIRPNGTATRQERLSSPLGGLFRGSFRRLRDEVATRNTRLGTAAGFGLPAHRRRLERRASSKAGQGQGAAKGASRGAEAVSGAVRGSGQGLRPTLAAAEPTAHGHSPERAKAPMNPRVRRRAIGAKILEGRAVPKGRGVRSSDLAAARAPVRRWPRGPSRAETAARSSAMRCSCE